MGVAEGEAKLFQSLSGTPVSFSPLFASVFKYRLFSSLRCTLLHRTNSSRSPFPSSLFSSIFRLASHSSYHRSCSPTNGLHHDRSSPDHGPSSGPAPVECTARRHRRSSASSSSSKRGVFCFHHTEYNADFIDELLYRVILVEYNI